MRHPGAQQAAPLREPSNKEHKCSMNDIHLDIKETEEGSLLSLKAQPGAVRNAINGVHDGCLKVQVTTPPDKGKANGAIIKLLSKELRIPKTDVEIVKGVKSRNKVVLFHGITPDKLRDLLISLM